MRARNSLVWLVLALICLVAYACTEPKTQPAQPNVNASSPTTAPGPLTPAAYRVEWSNPQVPAEMLAGRPYTVSATIKNVSNEAWPATAKGGGSFNLIEVGYHWLPAEGKEPIVWDGTRTPLPHDIAAGETVTLTNIRVQAPTQTGSLRLQISLLNEGVTWFEARGGKTLIVPVTVR
jgi:hypothetical protein